MPWQRVNPRQQIGQTVTIRANGGLAFSGKFIATHRLEEHHYVETFVDADLRRIGFKFQKTPGANTSYLQRESGAGRVMNSAHLTCLEWFAPIMNMDLAERRFLVETDESITGPEDGVAFYISLGYRFKARRSCSDEDDYPRSPGVYRLFHRGELVRIGESDCIERRLKEHKGHYGEEVDEYDFCRIDDAMARKSEEKQLLEEYRDAYGRLPRLNRIGA